MADIRGDLAVKVVKGINLQNLSVFGTCNPYVLVKLRSSLDSMTTSVKDGEDNPSWQDTFTFRSVSSTDELQISLMEKEGEREGVVSVANYIPSTLWGFPGTGGVERELKVTMPSTAGRKADRPDMGTVVLRLQYRAELLFRVPFDFFKTAAAKTGELTEKAKIDVAIDKILNLALKPATMATGVAGRMTKKEKLISGGAVAVVGAGTSVGLLAMAAPVGFLALMFLPLTLMGGFFLAMVAMMLLPMVLVLGWIVLCSRPVQCRLWMPALFWAVATIPNVKKVVMAKPKKR